MSRNIAGTGLTYICVECANGISNDEWQDEEHRIYVQTWMGNDEHVVDPEPVSNGRFDCGSCDTHMYGDMYEITYTVYSDSITDLINK